MGKTFRSLTILLMSLGALSTQAASKFDQDLIKAHQSARSFEAWVVGMAKDGYAGDEKYFTKLFKNTPELIKNKELPKLIYEKGVFTLREGKQEVKFELSEKAGQVQIDGKKEVVFLPTDLVSQKLKKILQGLNGQKSAHILWMPVAWAQGQGQPTRMSVALTAMVEKVSRSTMLERAEQLGPKLAEASKIINRSGKVCIDEIQNFEEEAAGEGLEVLSMKCAPLGRSGIVETQILLTQTENAVILRMTDAGFQVTSRDLSGEYQIQQVNPIEGKKSSGDAPTSQTSSPAQRSAMGGEFVPVKGSSMELMFRYMGFATPQRRNLCQKCMGEVAAYEQAVMLIRQGAMDQSQPVKGKPAIE